MKATAKLDAILQPWQHLVTRTVAGWTENPSPDRTGTVWASRGHALCQAANTTWLDRAMGNQNVCAIIVDCRLNVPDDTAGKALIFSRNANELFLRLHLAGLHLANKGEGEKAPRVHPDAKIHTTATLSGDVTVGDGVRIGPNVSVSGPAIIGEGTVIDANAVIGTDGLFAKRLDGHLVDMPHYGGVRIGRGCHVHAGAVIVRSSFFEEWTTVGDEARIGVMANVGHDALIGIRTVLSSNSVIAGRAQLGTACWIGASATVANTVVVGDGAKVMVGAVAIADVAAGAVVSGNFARDHQRNLLDHARRNRERS